MEFLFTVEGDFQLSSWSPFLESFKNHQKETNIAAKIKVVNMCSNCGLEGFQEKGGRGEAAALAEEENYSNSDTFIFQTVLDHISLHHRFCVGV